MTLELLAENKLLRKKVEKYEKAIEDIKAEIKEKANFDNVDTLVEVIRIIDKHIVKEQGSEEL